MDLKMMDTFMTIVLITVLVLNLINKHDLGVLIYRIVLVICYTFLMGTGLGLNMYLRGNQNFYSAIILQHFSFIMKKISQVYLYYRLKNKMHYDDISFYYISIIVMEYCFIFEYVLVQDNSQFQKSVAVFNFIAIQTQNVTNTNIFYQIYHYLRTNKYLAFKRLIVFQYLIIIIFSIYHFMFTFLASL